MNSLDTDLNPTPPNGGAQAACTESSTSSDLFRRVWQKSTSDKSLSLYGFRRFRTTHLLNLRFLEEEITDLDRKIYQAGSNLNIKPSSTDRLGLRHFTRDANALPTEEVITPALILKLRDLIKQYDDGIIAFNKIVQMETFSLIEDQHQSDLKNNLSLHESFKTRLVRVDSRDKPVDPLQEQIHEWLRNFRYQKLSRQDIHDAEQADSPPSKARPGHQTTSRDSGYLAEWSARFIVALVASLFLVVPLVILTFQSKKKIQLVTVLCSILVFCFVMSLLMKTANFQTVAAAAGYAAVVSVFVSGGASPGM